MRQLRPDTGDGQSLPCVRCGVTTPDASYQDGLPVCDNCAAPEAPGADGLIAFVRQQLDDEERAARRLPGRLYVDDDGCVETPHSQWSDGSDRLPNHHNTWLLIYDQAERLAEVEAKRRILDAWQLQIDEDDPHAYLAGDVLPKLLAQPYAGRDGWREEWRA